MNGPITADRAWLRSRSSRCSTKPSMSLCHLCGEFFSTRNTYDALATSAPESSGAILARISAVCDAYPYHQRELGTLNQRERLLLEGYLLAPEPHKALLRLAAHARIDDWPQGYLETLDRLISFSQDLDCGFPVTM